MCYQTGKLSNQKKKKKENWITILKNLFAALWAENDLILNELDYKNTQRLSKLKLPNILEPSKL